MTKFENNKVRNANPEKLNAATSVNKKCKTVFSTFIRSYYVFDISQITDLDVICYSQYLTLFPTATLCYAKNKLRSD